MTGDVLTVVLGMALRATALLFAAGLGAWALRHAPAAHRHRIWALALGGCLALPVAHAAVPAWEVRAESLGRVALLAASRAAPAPPTGERPLSSATPSTVHAAVASAPWNVAQPADRGIRLDAALAGTAAWIAGAILLLGWYLVGWTAAFVQTRRARPAPSDLLRTVQSLALGLGIRAPVALRITEHSVIPFVFGAFRPVVLLPVEALQWDAARLRAVLTHELAHVRRRDGVVQLMLVAVTALYWFHPGVWIALNRLEHEREAACDDAVLVTGVSAADYARHLVETARACRAAAPRPGLAVARRATLEHRVVAILDHRRVRHVSPGSATAATLLAGAIFLPLAALRAAPPAALVPSRPITAITGETAPPFCEAVTRTAVLPEEGWISLLNYNHGARIEGWDEPYVSVTVRKCAYARERLGEASFVMTPRNGGYHLESVYADPRSRSWNLDDPTSPRNPATFEYVIRVPRRASLTKVQVFGGPLHIEGIDGSVEAEAANGPLTARELRGAVVLSSANGLVALALTAAPAHPVVLRSVNGPVALDLPEGTRASIGASTETGRITSNVPLSRQWGARGTAELNGGGPGIHLASTFAEVRLSVGGTRRGTPFVIDPEPRRPQRH